MRTIETQTPTGVSTLGETLEPLKTPIAVFAMSYEEPFGNIIRQTGDAADDNPFRFSTKYHDDETGLVYYGYRYYDPELGRWLSRDPAQERGGRNLYLFVKNDPVGRWDLLGLVYCKLSVTFGETKAQMRENCRTSAGRAAPYGCFSGRVLHTGDGLHDNEVVGCGFLLMRQKLAVPYAPCEGSIHVRDDAPEITLAHEMRHFENYKKWYKKYSALMEKAAGRCACRPCVQAVVAWVAAEYAAFAIETEIEDLGNDIEDYPSLGPAGEKWARTAKMVRTGVAATLGIREYEAREAKGKARRACAGQKEFRGVIF